jgi:hypothetical protein
VSDEPESADPARRRRERHYGPVLVLLVAFPAIGAVSASRVGTAISAIMVLALWVTIIRATGGSRALLRGGLVVGVILAVVAVLAAVWDRNGLLAAVELVVAGGVFAILVMLLKALVRERSVTLSTIAGVLSAYLLIGLFFTGLYAASALISDTAFASVTTPLERFDLLYFSFITLATVGYGDITPLADPTRAMAMTEAVTGQLFLVTVVARVVALFPGRASAG